MNYDTYISLNPAHNATLEAVEDLVMDLGNRYNIHEPEGGDLKIYLYDDGNNPQPVTAPDVEVTDAVEAQLEDKPYCFVIFVNGQKRSCAALINERVSNFMFDYSRDIQGQLCDSKIIYDRLGPWDLSYESWLIRLPYVKEAVEFHN